MLYRIFNKVEYIVCYLLGRWVSIDYVIKYLRNPSHSHTSVRLLRSFGAVIGQNVTIKRSLYLDNVYEDKNSAGDFSNLNIGNNCYIGDAVYIDLSNKVTLEPNVVLSGRVSLITHQDCNRSPYLREKFKRKSLPVVIEEGAWLAFSSTVLCGVKVGANSVLGGHSLLTKSNEPYSFMVGLPASLSKHTSGLESGHPLSQHKD